MVAASAPPTEVFRRGRSAPAVRAWVSDYCGYRTEAAPPSVHHGVASAHLTFLLCLDGTIEMLADADHGQRPGSFTAVVAGLHTTPALIALGPAQTGLQLRLTWRGARALFGVPAGALAGGSVDLAALLGRRSESLLDALAGAPDWASRFALLDTELAALAGRGPGTSAVAPEVGYAWDRLVVTGGTLRIAELAAEIGWSRRHLAGRFRAETGLAPKAAARVIRFERACDLLRSRGRPGLSEVASTCGYVDQAHLSRDFRALAGLTATQWLAERPAD